MVDPPQDREAAANKLFDAMGITMHNIYFSVSSAEIVRILEGSAESMASLEMVTMSNGTFTSIDAKEVTDSKSMTAAGQPIMRGPGRASASAPAAAPWASGARSSSADGEAPLT